MPTDTLPEETERPPDIPPGRCWCGCGQRTRIATRTNRARGVIRGHPVRYVSGHYTRRPAPACDGNLRPCPNPGCDLMVHPAGRGPCDRRHHTVTSRRCTGCARNRNTQDRLEPHKAAQEWGHYHGLLGYTTRQFAKLLEYSPDGIRKIMLALPERNRARQSFLAAWAREREREAQERAAVI